MGDMPSIPGRQETESGCSGDAPAKWKQTMELVMKYSKEGAS